MKKFLLTAMLLAQMLMPGAAWCEIEIVAGSKTHSVIRAKVVAKRYIEVTDAQGHWPNVLVLEQSGGLNSPFEAQLNLMVRSLPAKFQVSLAANPTLVSESHRFQSVEVKLEPASGGAAQLIPLTPAILVFTNTIYLTGSGGTAPGPGDISTGNYMLKIRAQPPDGRVQEVGGIYTGQLSMIFEPVAQTPP
ncbi:hypothetical protein DBR37_11575 [Herminiimonas sp. KBW02]|uniref:hypothetical protein n=1 Tax=Herminiimonas sp. KBW02 TaxID=2153363 RepID=UPI000F59E6EF|nr:hypothetical protein [Herminiimonas sp. KBW02]RQO35001.1 hypothetical protein DBR37_11575 [Herminiimonas sp. KBW02]